MDQSKEIINGFETTLYEFVQLLSSFSEEQINTVPFEGSWTGAQVGQHIFKVIEFMPETLQGKVKNTDRNPLEKREQIRSVFLDFNTKMKSPDFIEPEIKNFKKDELIKEFKNKLEQTLEVAKSLDLSKTCMDFEMPVFGHLTRMELIDFAAVHTQRHMRQLKKIYEKAKSGKFTH
ncbi:MAG: DinB family protein [Chitinophagaceae bacterium]